MTRKKKPYRGANATNTFVSSQSLRIQDRTQGAADQTRLVSSAQPATHTSNAAPATPSGLAAMTSTASGLSLRARAHARACQALEDAGIEIDGILDEDAEIDFDDMSDVDDRLNTHVGPDEDATNQPTIAPTALPAAPPILPTPTARHTPPTAAKTKRPSTARSLAWTNQRYTVIDFMIQDTSMADLATEQSARKLNLGKTAGQQARAKRMIEDAFIEVLKRNAFAITPERRGGVDEKVFVEKRLGFKSREAELSNMEQTLQQLPEKFLPLERLGPLRAFFESRWLPPSFYDVKDDNLRRRNYKLQLEAAVETAKSRDNDDSSTEMMVLVW